MIDTQWRQTIDRRRRTTVPERPLYVHFLSPLGAAPYGRTHPLLIIAHIFNRRTDYLLSLVGAAYLGVAAGGGWHQRLVSAGTLQFVAGRLVALLTPGCFFSWYRSK